MGIPENQLKSWSHQGATVSAREAHESIRDALSLYGWPPGMKPEVYLQGSYKNETNIRGDSDVDVVVQLNGIQPNDWGGNREQVWRNFRHHVLVALKNRYGPDRVREEPKSLKVQTPYFRADVVVCLQYLPPGVNSSQEGMTFYVPSEGRWLVNYPKLHYKNGTEKNKKTNGWYKPTIRVFKNARNYLAKERGIPDPKNLAPSYFVECLLYNVPDDKFGKSFGNTFLEVVTWLVEQVFSQRLKNFVCQNERVRLFGSNPEQWLEVKAQEFILAMAELWEGWK